MLERKCNVINITLARKIYITRTKIHTSIKKDGTIS